MAHIEHSGVVKEVNPEAIVVDVIVLSACDKCHIKGACHTSSETAQRIVEIARKDDKLFVVGEKVTLFFSERTGLSAVLWAYVIPVIIILLALVTMLELEVSEPISALASLIFIFTYFIILYIFRADLQSKLKINIEKYRY